MKYKVFKRVTRKYEEKFSKERKTDEIRINVNGVEIHITEQQYGHSIDEPYVTIYIPNDFKRYGGVDSYGMSFDTFIKRITNCKKVST